MKVTTMKAMLAAMCGFILCSCAGLNGNVPFEYQPSLIKGSQIDGKAGMMMLADNRPEEDLDSTSGIKDISEKVTGKILEDFAKTGVFKDIHYGTAPEDTLLIDGRINRFSWNLATNPITYIPILDLLVFFGMPMYSIEAVTDITLQVHDKKSGTTATYTGSSEVFDRYSLYRFKTGEAGSELAESFRESMKMIKDQMMSGSTGYIQNDPVNAVSREEKPSPRRRDERHYSFSIHVFGFNPIYTTNYSASVQSISNGGRVSFSGSNAESAPAWLGGAGIKFSPARRFFVSLNVFSPYSQKGTMNEQITMPFGSAAKTENPTVTHDMSFGLDLDYLVYATPRSRWYAGAGYIRSAFSLKHLDSLNNIYVPTADFSTQAGMSLGLNQHLKNVDLFRINAGYEWLVTKNLSLSLFAYYPFSRNVKISAEGLAYSRNGGPDSYDSVSNTLVELKNPILVNMILSLYF